MFIKCDKHTKDKLQRIAKRNHRSINKEVEYMISMYVEEPRTLPNCFINNGTIYNIGTIKNQFVLYKSREYCLYSYFFVMMRLIG
ncbi:hypothetical protein SAMN02746066_00001 [Anaerosporobacter mobilis DSM 15930]|uniref:Arc-like DNA binding domain-containing protein n=1 Tax=Anaerosporobacter mobilis DSM 15930 TaxID=1120996 RepID=A0A1M7EI26_9FIRM|nr:hypothetical protein SAMN02746066_00001 [Anaerosporobacter mobilis DSM 15930]